MVYTELHKQHLALWLPAIVLFALAAIGFYFIPLGHLPKMISSLILVLLTLGMIGIAFLFYYKYALINCIFAFDEEKLTWELEQTTFIYPKQKQTTNWQNIAKIARIDDKHHTSYYFTWKTPDFTIMLQQPFIASENDTIWQDLLQNAAKNNIPIHSTFYDNTPPPKEVGVLLFVLIMGIFADVGWYFHPEIPLEKVLFIVAINLVCLFLGVKWLRNRKKTDKTKG